LGGNGGGGRVVAAHIERAGIHDPLALQVLGLKDETFIAAAKNGALAIWLL
jgi:hypothetical protein